MITYNNQFITFTVTYALPEFIHMIFRVANATINNDVIQYLSPYRVYHKAAYNINNC